MTHAPTPATDTARSTTTPRRLRVIAYVRVSTEDQRKGFSVTYTLKKILRHFDKKGWEHVGTYKDEGYSGSLDHTQRPDLGRLMQEARREPRPFNVVCVWEERAIGRRDRAFGPLPWVWELKDFGVFTAVSKGDYDNTTEEGRKKIRDKAAEAEDERILIRGRTQGGIQKKTELGGHFGGPPPYG